MTKSLVRDVIWDVATLFGNFTRNSIALVCRQEHQSQRYRCSNEGPVAYRFAFDALSRVGPTTVLDVGTGTTSLPHLMSSCGFIVTASDNIYDYWPTGLFNRHFHVINDDITNTKFSTSFDFITCISVLQHIRDHNAAVRSMFRLLNPGGHMVLTFPYNEMQGVENAYTLPDAGYGKDAPYICRIFCRKDIDGWLAVNPFRIVQQEFWQCFTGKFWTVGARLFRPRQVFVQEKHQLTCLLLQK